MVLELLGVKAATATSNAPQFLHQLGGDKCIPTGGAWQSCMLS